MTDKEPTRHIVYTKDGQTITVESCYREDVPLLERMLRYLMKKQAEACDGSGE